MQNVMQGVCRTLIASSLVFCSPSVWACLPPSALTALADQEMQYLLQRVPPAFADAVADQIVQGRMTLHDASTCQIGWQMQLPAADVAEAQALLQVDVAKRIMLAAQGYEIPAQTTLTAEFKLAPGSMQIMHNDTLQTAELGKLRASVELMYALLTQARANGLADKPVSWSAAELQTVQAQCGQQFKTAPAGNGCVCVM